MSETEKVTTTIDGVTQGIAGRTLSAPEWRAGVEDVLEARIKELEADNAMRTKHVHLLEGFLMTAMLMGGATKDAAQGIVDMAGSSARNEG